MLMEAVMTILQKNIICFLLIFIFVSFASAGYALNEADIIDAKEVKSERLNFVSGSLEPLPPVSSSSEEMGFIKEYQEKFFVVEQEISTVEKNLKWLEFKVKRMEAFHRFVPVSMENSIEFKKERLVALKKVKKCLRDLLKAAGYTIDYSYKKIGSGQKKRAVVQRTEGVKRSLENLKTADFKNEILGKIEKSGLGSWVEIVTDGSCLKLETRLPILFASGSAALVKEYKIFFKDLAALLKEYDVRVFVDGYADINSINTKKYPSNFELGAARAANVVHELVKYGIKPSVFQIGSTGRYRPRAKGMSKRKTLERRVDLTILRVSNAKLRKSV